MPEFDSHFKALSFRFRVTSNVPGSGPVLSRLLSPFSLGERADGAATIYDLRDHGETLGLRYTLWMNAAKIQEVAVPGSMLDWLIADFSRQAVERSQDRLAIHAGVVSDGAIAALFPAAPDAGKTTLTVGLTRAGFSFLSDEVAALDPDAGLVHPFPRPILMDPASVDLIDGLRRRLPSAYERFRFRRYHLAPDDVCPGSLGAACRVGVVIAPAYRPGAVTAMEPMSRSDTLTHLATNAFNLERFGRKGFQAIARIARECRGYRLSIGDLTSAIGMVTELLDTEGSGLPSRRRPVGPVA